MFMRPDDLTDDDIVRVVAEGWEITAERVEYAAVGFGSHHWHVHAGSRRWFLTVDDLDARRIDASDQRADVADRLTAALTIACGLRDSGLDFVIAPLSSLDGHVIHPVNHRYVCALYPYVDGQHHEWSPYSNRNDRLALLARLVTIHGTTLGADVPVDDFAIPSRDELADAMRATGAQWSSGPYAGPARSLLHRNRNALAQALADYDRRVDAMLATRAHLVVTHGEPHRANTITTAHGVVLIDWETALLAPPERDLWSLIDEDPSVAIEYEQRRSRPVDGAMTALYRLRWDLTEIALFAVELRQPHGDTPDTRLAWAKFQESLDPARWHQH